MPISDYDATVSDWRRQLLLNERKTRAVIALFCMIYGAVGIVADVFLLTTHYPGLTIEQSLYALFTLSTIPYATLIMAAIALLTLGITFRFYDRIMLLGTQYHEITPNEHQNLSEKQAYNVIEEMKVAAGLRFMPKVFVIDANYMNAFASGYSEKSAMVAITRGLLEKLDRAELQAVMAHELSHIRHGDIKLSLTVAVLSNILLIVIDVLFYSVVFRSDKRRDNRIAVVIIVLRYVLPLLTIVLTLFLSRTREYMADAGAVELMRDNEPMVRALLKINDDNCNHAEQYQQEYRQTAHEQLRQQSYLYDPCAIDPIKSLTNAFATHPAIEQRIRALGYSKKK